MCVWMSLLGCWKNCPVKSECVGFLVHVWPHLATEETAVRAQGVCFYGDEQLLGRYLAYWKCGCIVDFQSGVGGRRWREVGGAVCSCLGFVRCSFIWYSSLTSGVRWPNKGEFSCTMTTHGSAHLILSEHLRDTPTALMTLKKYLKQKAITHLYVSHCVKNRVLCHFPLQCHSVE